MHIRTQILLSRFAHINRRYFRTGEAKIYQLFRHYSVCIFRSEKLLINVWNSGRLSIFAQISVLFHFMPCLPTHYLAFFYHKSPFPDPSCTFPDPFTTPFHDNFPLHFLTIKNNFWLKYGYFSRLVWEWGISSGKCLICHACTTKHYVGPFMDDFDQCTIDCVIFVPGLWPLFITLYFRIQCRLRIEMFLWRRPPTTRPWRVVVFQFRVG